eukprot:scaffold36145_cov69-Phaeocystis_antarctica.AAC.7
MPSPMPPTLLYKSKSVALVASLRPEPESSTANLAESPPPGACSTLLSSTCMSISPSVTTCVSASGTSTRSSTPGCSCGRTTAAAERTSSFSSVGASASSRLPVSAPCSVASVRRNDRLVDLLLECPESATVTLTILTVSYTADRIPDSVAADESYIASAHAGDKLLRESQVSHRAVERVADLVEGHRHHQLPVEAARLLYLLYEFRALLVFPLQPLHALKQGGPPAQLPLETFAERLVRLGLGLGFGLGPGLEPGLGLGLGSGLKRFASKGSVV